MRHTTSSTGTGTGTGSKHDSDSPHTPTAHVSPKAMPPPGKLQVPFPGSLPRLMARMSVSSVLGEHRHVGTPVNSIRHCGHTSELDQNQDTHILSVSDGGSGGGYLLQTRWHGTAVLHLDSVSVMNRATAGSGLVGYSRELVLCRSRVVACIHWHCTVHNLVLERRGCKGGTVLVALLASAPALLASMINHCTTIMSQRCLPA